MHVIADTHVHVYPRFVCAGLFSSISARMDRLAGGKEHVNALFLAERRDCNWFRDARAGNFDRRDQYSVELPAGDANTVVISGRGMSPLYVMAGRQIATSERLEVLALLCDADLPDGKPVVDIIRAVFDCGGLPVLAWAPGKWSLGRSSIVEKLVEAGVPGMLLVGDSAIRPQSWREPFLMRKARNRGLTILCGTDALPLAAEEQYIGTYCSAWDGEFDPLRPSLSMRQVLTSANSHIEQAGGRCNTLAALWRLMRLRVAGGR